MKQTIRHGATIDTVTPGELAEFLRDISTTGHVAYGSDSIERKLRDWPVKGSVRQVATARAHGDQNFVLAAGAFVDIVGHDIGRGGLSLINVGANPCFVYLDTANNAQQQKVATGYLSPGGSWDGKISDVFWCGNVSVQSVLGTALVLAIL